MEAPLGGLRQPMTMNTEMICQIAGPQLDETVPFSEVIRRLFAAGVEYYHIDYEALRQTFYGPAGDQVVAPILYEGLPAVAPQFDVEQLRALILDSVRSGQTYRDFTRRAIAAGVQGSFAFLRVKQVTYWGRNGGQHIEWFPGDGPLKVAA